LDPDSSTRMAKVHDLKICSLQGAGCLCALNIQEEINCIFLQFVFATWAWI
jgi:hypothetical protein